MKNFKTHRYFIFITLASFILYSCNKDSSIGPENQNNNNSALPATVRAELTEIAMTNFRCNLARFSSDGNYLVGTINQYWVSYSSVEPESVYYFDIQSNKLIRTYYMFMDIVDEFDCTAISPDGKYVAGGGVGYNGWFGRGVAIWSTANSEFKTYNNHFKGSPRYLEYTPSGDTLYVYTSTNDLYRWDIYRNKLDTLTVAYSLYDEQYFHITPDSKYLLFSGSLKLVDLSTNPITVKELNPGFHGDFLPDHKKLIISYGINKVSLYDIVQDKVIKTVESHYTKYHYRVAVSPSGKYFATTYDIGEDEYSITEWGVQIWETATMSQIGKANIFDPKYVEFGPNDSKIVVTSDGGAKVFEIKYIPIKE